MEKKRKTIQVYAIIVNVVAIVTFLISTTSLLSAVIDRNDPLYAGYSNIDLSSFEKYKMDVLKSTEKGDAYIPTDQVIKDMYAAAKEDKIKRMNHQTFRTIMVSSVAITVAIFLFLFHWNLAKKYDSVE